jgi:hypothetical protein
MEASDDRMAVSGTILVPAAVDRSSSDPRRTSEPGRPVT